MVHSADSQTPVALVTGASSGIGRELALELARAGHRVVLTARREAQLRALAEEIRAAGGVADWCICDLSDPAGPAQLATAMRERGFVVEVLINNAGLGAFGFFADTPPDRNAAMIQVNITALTELTRLLLPEMRARGRGRILMVASTAAFQPGPLMAVYYATKAYVLSLSEALANELHGTGITVSALCPGPTATEFTDVAGMYTTALKKSGWQMSARAVAQAGLRGLQRGKRVIIPGFLNSLLAQSTRFAPRRLSAATVRWLNEHVRSQK